MAQVTRSRAGRGKPGWLLDFIDAAGIRRQLTFATRPEAQAAFKRLVPARTARRGRRRPAIDARVQFEPFVTDWLDAHEAGLKSRSRQGYRWIAEKYLIPLLGPLRVADLDRRNVGDALRTLLTTGRAFTHGTRKGEMGAGPLAKRTVGLAHTVLHTCLESAVDQDILPANPATGLAGKRRLKLTASKLERQRRVAMRICSADELVLLEDYAAAHEPAWLPMLLTLTRVGLRAGEALALEISDFSDRSGGSLRVRQAVNLKTKKLEPPKAGPRVVDLSGSPQLVAVLRAHVAGLRALGVIPHLFPANTARSGKGGRVGHQRLARAVARMARAAGIGHHLSPHDLRHTYATLMLNAPGMDLFYVSRQLGHATITETIETYGCTAQPRLATAFVGLLDRASAATVHAAGARNGGYMVANGADRDGDLPKTGATTAG